MSKLLLYSDWLTALGGGERYLYALAEAIASAGEVTIGAPELPSGERMERLGFPLRYPAVQIPRSALPKETAAYDLFVHLTLRLPMPSAAGRSIAIVQFPADSADRLRAWRHPRNRLRTGPPRRALSGYEFVVFSEFVRGWLRRRWGVDAEILTPPLLSTGRPGVEELLPRKEPQILSVARFFGDGQMKRQDVLVEAFRRLPARVRREWRLVLAGVVGPDERSKAFTESLRRSAAGLDVRFAFDQSPLALDELYRTSSIYWHAAGFGRPARHPERAEHFGMSTVEAMSRAVVPVVFPDGGQLEIVAPGVGRIWRSIDELVHVTDELANDAELLRSYQRGAYQASSAYSLPSFRDRARQLLLVGRHAVPLL